MQNQPQWTRRVSSLAAVAVLILTGLLLSAAPARAQVAAPSALTVPFKVFPENGGAPLYVGEYVVTLAGSQVTELQHFRTPAGKAQIERESVFNLEKRRPVSFVDRNLITGKVYKATVLGDKISVHIEDVNGSENADKTVSLPKDAFIWPNFSYVLAQDWDALNRKSETYESRIFVLSRQDDYGMRVMPEGDVTVEGIAGRRFRLEPSSAFARAIAPATRLTFARHAPHRVIQYEGNGAVSDQGGKPIEVTIVFEWPKE